MAPTTTTKTAPPKTKTANGGVKKATGAKGGRKANAKNAMAKMQAYCKFTLPTAEPPKTRQDAFSAYSYSNPTARDATIVLTCLTVKAHRHEYKDLPFKEQQKELGKKVRLSRVSKFIHFVVPQSRHMLARDLPRKCLCV